MKKILLTIVILIILGFIAYNYAFRAPSAPSEDVNTVVDTATSTTIGQMTYKISKDSVVEFRINEVLNGSPKTAIGTTSEIAGDISLSSTTVNLSTLAINARTFKTDSTNRDGAIARFILKSEDPANEFMYFKPTGVTGTLANFTVTGDLTVSGVTKPETFTVNAQITNNVLIGKATVKLKRSDFKLSIPNVKFVASVDDEFTVTANIVAPKAH